MEFVALVTLLLIFQYMTFMMLCGMARAKGDVKAPATSGDEMYERALRVQMNTVEQLVITLPAMWICAMYYRPCTTGHWWRRRWDWCFSWDGCYIGQLT
jgi:hypothetical protein